MKVSFPKEILLFLLTRDAMTTKIESRQNLIVSRRGKNDTQEDREMAGTDNKTKGAKKLTVPPIGAMLLAEEYIVPQDLDLALEHQRYSKSLIGEILIRLGAVRPDELLAVLTEQQKLFAK
jgi:hypothetical protein